MSTRKTTSMPTRKLNGKAWLKPVPLSPNARVVLEKRYLRKGAQGTPVETVEEMFWRVAYHVAKAEETWGGDVNARAVEFYHLLTSKKFFPNSPTFTGAGTPLGQLAACQPYHARVVTSRGLIPIGELVEKQTASDVVTFQSPESDEPVSAYRAASANFGPARLGKILAGVPNGVRPVMRVTVLGGVHLDVTPDHLVWASPPSKHGRFGWHEAGEIEPGWLLMVDSRPKPFPAEQVEGFDEATAAVVAWLQADGYVGQPATATSPIIEFETINDDEFNWIQEQIARSPLVEFHQKVHEEVVQNEALQYRRIRIYGKEPYALLRQYGLAERKAAARVPEQVFRSPVSVVASYLRALFQCDGSVESSGFISVSSVSCQLLEGVQLLLLQLGISSQIIAYHHSRERRLPNYKLHIGLYSSRVLFEQKVGFVSREKQEKLATLNQQGGKQQSTLRAVEVDRVAYLGEMPVFDIQTSDSTYLSAHLAVHNCFVLPITDDMGRDSAGIFQTLRDAALIQQTGGGNGFSFSRLRPKGGLVKSSAGQATGPVGFLRVYDHAFGEVAQGGTRRGANMGVLRVDHPDIEEFITSKTNENAITNFNISVGITDAFMRAVKEDEEWELRFPDIAAREYRNWSGTLEQAEKAGMPIRSYGKVRARDLFDKIVKQAHHNGEPGVLFLDAANRGNPVPHLYQLESTNPCHRGTNLVHTNLGVVPIKDLVGCEFQVITPEGEYARATAYPTGIKPLFRVHLSNGSIIDLTKNHNLIMSDGSKRMVRDLIIGDEIKLSKHAVMPEMEMVGAYENSMQQTFSQTDLHQNWHDTILVDFVTVASVEDLRIVEEVYNITVDHPLHQFAVNGIISANCGEQFLGPYENCCLGSVNLNEHCGADGTVDWESLRQSVVTATRFLDDVVEANAYVPAVPQLKEAAHRARRIGLGIMGLADLMYHAGVRYGSKEGQEFGAQVMEFVRYHAMKTSIELAEARGPFPAIEGSIYDQDDMKWTPPQALDSYQNNWGRPTVEWEAILEGIRRHGIRNAAQTTVAPTGTIATVAGCEGYGCEPVFALAYIRHVNDHGKDLKLTYASPRFDAVLKKLGLGEEKRQEIVEQVMSEGTCQHIAELPQAVRDTFVVSADITAEEHVRMQAALQAFVDNSLSKTVNFHETATEHDVANAYMLAWELGCKGITVYVTGSREKVVLETKATADKKTPRTDLAPGSVSTPAALAVATLWHEAKKPRPRALTGRTFNVDTPVGKAFITINENGGAQPFEVFINTSKAGSETAAVSEAIGRLISYILRIVSPVMPSDRMKEIVRQLLGIGGGRSLGFGPNRVRSLPDGIGQVLDTYLRDKSGIVTEAPTEKFNGGNGGHTIEAEMAANPPTQKIGDLCPECGEAAVVNEEGCRKCYACGYSEC